MLRAFLVLASMLIVGVLTMFLTAISLGKPKTSDEFSTNSLVVWSVAILASIATGALATYFGRRG